MPFDPTLAAIRFGCGLSPSIAPPVSVAEMVAALSGPDRMAGRFPIPGPLQSDPTEAHWRDIQRDRRLSAASADAALIAEVDAAFEAARAATLASRRAHMIAVLSRNVTATDGFRERLVRFWADHFTIRSRASITAHLVAPTIEAAIRPHVTGTFADMLRAVVTSPMMIQYLDQGRSVGPRSPQGLRTGRGLNENLAREVLELHTVGVGAGYTQDDVRELAELFTGLNYRPEVGFVFQRQAVEPGAETVLGVTYDREASLDQVFAVLDDLALHPETARHIARKLAVHFVADNPDPSLVAALEVRYLQTGGDLGALAATLLDHPAAWAAERAKIKQPFDFVTSAFRALGVTARELDRLTVADLRQMVEIPLRIMGQDWEKPIGPDGWPEEAAAWVTPQGMAGRIDWAMRVPVRVLPRLPDPRDFARTALGPAVPENVAFAASAAEDRAVGVGVVLSSAAFQRR